MRPVLGVGALFLSAAALAGAPEPAGDPGRIAFQKCYACHDVTPGNDVAGPSLHAIVGRPIAARPGYEYSAALRALAEREGRWNEALLDRFIADPEAVAPGTSMTFTGMRDPRERADLIAWLGRQSE
ncbi:c-type cytochrome [Allosphingosinicella sp.]|uniref:c-type cytochrome n=1 Tax=Allosphingosinicella sp. TaxID=2823234 RepID=UPI002FC1D25F